MLRVEGVGKHQTVRWREAQVDGLSCTSVWTYRSTGRRTYRRSIYLCVAPNPKPQICQLDTLAREFPNGWFAVWGQMGCKWGHVAPSHSGGTNSAYSAVWTLNPKAPLPSMPPGALSAMESATTVDLTGQIRTREVTDSSRFCTRKSSVRIESVEWCAERDRSLLTTYWSKSTLSSR